MRNITTPTKAMSFEEPQEDQDAAPEEQASPEAETPAEEPQAAPKTRKRKT